MKKKVIEQPDRESEILLDSVINNNESTVTVRGKEWKLGWLYKGTIRKVTSIMLDYGVTEKDIEDKVSGKTYHADEDKITCKCAAAMKLNGYWSIKFFYWFLWRWYYYFKQYRDDELLPFIAECKKKVDVPDYCLNIISLIGMKDTAMTMTRAEVQRTQAELLMAQHGASPKSTTESPSQSTTSGD